MDPRQPIQWRVNGSGTRSTSVLNSLKGRLLKLGLARSETFGLSGPAVTRSTRTRPMGSLSRDSAFGATVSRRRGVSTVSLKGMMSRTNDDHAQAREAVAQFLEEH